MPSRGGVRKVGCRREDAMKQIGFPTDIVKRKLKQLLDAYGEVGWIFIEEASYKVLIEAILEDQNEDHGESSTNLITCGDKAESSASAAALADAPHDQNGLVESLVNQLSEQSADVGLSKANGEEARTSNKETFVGDYSQLAGGEQQIAGNSSVSLAAQNAIDHVETGVKSSELERAQSNDQPAKRQRKSYHGWYNGSEDRDVIDVSKFLSYKPPPTSEQSGGTKNAKERKSMGDLKPAIL